MAVEKTLNLQGLLDERNLSANRRKNRCCSTSPECAGPPRAEAAVYASHIDTMKAATSASRSARNSCARTAASRGPASCHVLTQAAWSAELLVSSMCES